MKLSNEMAREQAERFKTIAKKLEAVIDRLENPITAVARSVWMTSMNGYTYLMLSTTHIPSHEDAEQIQHIAEQYAPSKDEGVLELLDKITDQILLQAKCR